MIVAIGVVIGFFYIRGMDKEKLEKENKIEESSGVENNEAPLETGE